MFFSHICKAYAHVVMRLIRLNYPFPGPRFPQIQIAFLPFYSQGLNLRFEFAQTLYGVFPILLGQ